MKNFKPETLLKIELKSIIKKNLANMKMNEKKLKFGI